MNIFISITCVSVLCFIYLVNTFVASCNESICGSIISKCLLMQLCTCAADNFTCSKECYHCMRNLYSECCSCVNLCDTPAEKFTSNGALSYVEELKNAVPGLFQALSEDPHAQGGWTSETFQVTFDVSQYNPQKTVKIQMQTNEQHINENENMLILNCSVVFNTGCTSVTKCRNICSSMGASGYRWFHDGCCECVGENCFNYGLNESKCRHCSNTTDLMDEISEDDLEYNYGDYYVQDEYDEED